MGASVGAPVGLVVGEDVEVKPVVVVVAPLLVPELVEKVEVVLLLRVLEQLPPPLSGHCN